MIYKYTTSFHIRVSLMMSYLFLLPRRQMIRHCTVTPIASHAKIASTPIMKICGKQIAMMKTGIVRSIAVLFMDLNIVDVKF